MKFTCEMTKKDFEEYDVLYFVADDMSDEISSSKELMEKIEYSIDDFCFNDLTFDEIDTEIKIDDLSVEDFLIKNIDEIWEKFKERYPEMIREEITKVDCCYNCKQFGKADLRANPEYGYCFLRKQKIKPNYCCKKGDFKD